MALRWLLSVAAVLWLVGCGSHPVESYSDKVRAAVETVCDCESIRTTATAAECVANAGLASEEAVQCAKDVYDWHEDVAKRSVECANDAAEHLKSCVERATCNAAAALACSNTFDDEAGACPPLPGDVLAELAACGYTT